MIIRSLLIMLLLCSTAFAKVDAKITFSGDVALGSDIASYNAFCDMKVGFNIYFWKCKNTLYGGSLTWMQMDWSGASAYPFREIYFYGNRFSLVGFYIDVKHFCNHPVYSSKIHGEPMRENYKWWSNEWGQTITAISIGYEFEFDVWHN